MCGIDLLDGDDFTPRWVQFHQVVVHQIDHQQIAIQRIDGHAAGHIQGPALEDGDAIAHAVDRAAISEGGDTVMRGIDCQHDIFPGAVANLQPGQPIEFDFGYVAIFGELTNLCDPELRSAIVLWHYVDTQDFGVELIRGIEGKHFVVVIVCLSAGSYAPGAIEERIFDGCEERAIGIQDENTIARGIGNQEFAIIESQGRRSQNAVIHFVEKVARPFPV